MVPPGVVCCSWVPIPKEGVMKPIRYYALRVHQSSDCLQHSLRGRRSLLHHPVWDVGSAISQYLEVVFFRFSPHYNVERLVDVLQDRKRLIPPLRILTTHTSTILPSHSPFHNPHSSSSSLPPSLPPSLTSSPCITLAMSR